ncbi:MAG: AAA family ATPase [Anaerolineales bacterium]|jgi:tetratricopeptide (TPR) repeat protein/transcriptional regulator with XRE-family HTH domain
MQLDNFVSFGYWVRRRRNFMDMTQAKLASNVSCSLSMLRKIERDERRPSQLLAELLAEHLAIDDAQRQSFLKVARGQFVTGIVDSDINESTDAFGSLLVGQAELGELRADQPTFVARERELGQLHEHLAKTMKGQGRMIFVSGEAGRGKTSLLHAFSQQAVANWPDLIVAGGSCDVYSGQGDPLLPFRDIFRILAGDLEAAGMKGIIDGQLAARTARALPITTKILLDHGPHLIDTIVPSLALESRLAQRFPQQQVSTELILRLQDQRARHLRSTEELQQDRLFEEITTTLNALARQQPLLLLLDDLHWADVSSTGLLGHLAMRLQQSSILIIGCYRTEDLAQWSTPDEHRQPASHPLQAVLSESQRRFGQIRIDLDHLDPNEAQDFVNALLDEEGNEFGTDFRKRLARLTEGHPLFVVELLRSMRERGDIIQGSEGRWKESEQISWAHVPARVEGIIEKRLGRLPTDIHDLLTVGCVQGESFYAEVTAAVRQISAGDLTRRLSNELDRQHHLIREQGIRHVGPKRLSQYRFRHHLFQKHLYEQLGAAERMYLHEAVGDALEALFSDRASTDEVPVTQLARHFEEARLDSKASRYLFAAGQNAASMFAYDEAAAYFERGLGLLENVARDPEIARREFELSLALARAFWGCGQAARAVATCEKSIEIARVLEEPEALARAVLAYEEPRWRLNLEAEPSQQYIREALDALRDDESGLRLRLLVSLSRTLLASGEMTELRTTVSRALRTARQINDPVALCDALRISAQIDRGPEATPTRLTAVEEMIATAQSIGDKERLADGLGLYVYDQLELGRIDLVDTAIAAQRQIAQEIKQPFQLHIAAVFQTMRAIMQGEFEEAERLATKASEISQQIGIAELDGISGVHMFTIRAEQGRLNEVAPIVKILVTHSPASASWRPGLALIYCSLGLSEECRVIFDELAADAFALVPRDSLWVTSLAYLAEVCAYLGDSERAATLYELLLPYDDRTVVVGGATACLGAAARYMGMLATTMSDWRVAERHFIGALDLDARMGARPWLAHSQYEYAVMLLGRGQAGDRLRALALISKAMTVAEEIGMVGLFQKGLTLQAQYEIARN